MTATAMPPSLRDPTPRTALARAETRGLHVSILERVKAAQERRPHVLVQLLIEIAESLG